MNYPWAIDPLKNQIHQVAPLPPNPPQPLPQTTGEKAFLPFVQGLGKKHFHNNLIVYYFKNLDLHEFITGAVQPKLNKANLLSIPLYLPENESEQKAIAEVLSSLDDKIDLLHRQNKTLEQMAETLFRQWFVEEAGIIP
jgi:restriction endonuclease S subunit